MNSSLILRTATRFMLPLLLLFSLFLLLRGHNKPGGGFVGGLVGASAFTLYALSFGFRAAREALWIEPLRVIAAGLLVALAAGVLPLLLGNPLLAHRATWIYLTLPGYGDWEIGTTLLFDIGVYLVVFGVTLLIVLALAEE
jgi:multicomponent Na+:H+ antiporter subunit B